MDWIYSLFWDTGKTNPVLADKLPDFTGPARNIFFSSDELKNKKLTLKSAKVVEKLRQSALLVSILTAKERLKCQLKDRRKGAW